jgi:hypothetical protein
LFGGTTARPNDTDAEQQQPRGYTQQAGEVVAGRPHLVRVVRGLDPRGDPQHAERQRHRDTPASAHARVRPRGEPEHRERHEPADEVIAGLGARLGLHVVVVNHVQPDDRDRDAEEEPLAAHGYS